MGYLFFIGCHGEVGNELRSTRVVCKGVLSVQVRYVAILGGDEDGTQRAADGANIAGGVGCIGCMLRRKKP
jgi:hypothetical protein